MKSLREKNLLNDWSGASDSVGRRTRSQLAPEWTTNDALTLVHEIISVQSDYLRALSAFQKWKMVSDACKGVGMAYSSDQCRRKWNSLLDDYDRIRQWHSGSGKGETYWSLEAEKRRELQLPESFDRDIFDAVDGHVRKRKGEETDPDSNPDAQADEVEIVEEMGMVQLGSKRQRQASMPPTDSLEQKPLTCLEAAQEIQAEEMYQQSHLEGQPDLGSKKPLMVHPEGEEQVRLVDEKLQMCCSKENACEIIPQERPLPTEGTEKPESSKMPRRKLSSQGVDQSMVKKLQEHAELIHSIVTSKLPEMSDVGNPNLKNMEDFHTYCLQRQADNLIASLRDIVNIIEEFPYLVQ